MNDFGPSYPPSFAPTFCQILHYSEGCRQPGGTKVAIPGRPAGLTRQLLPASDLQQFSSGRGWTRSQPGSHSHIEPYKRSCCRKRRCSHDPHHRSVRVVWRCTACLLPHLRVQLTRHLENQSGRPDYRTRVRHNCRRCRRPGHHRNRPRGRLAPRPSQGMLNNPFLDSYLVRRKGTMQSTDDERIVFGTACLCVAAAYVGIPAVRLLLKKRLHSSTALIRGAIRHVL